MSNENTTESKTEFPFYKKNVETALTVVALILCAISFMYDKNKIILIVFFVITALIIIYYFFWKKKGSTYVMVDQKEITVYHGIFFKKVTIPQSSILEVRNYPYYLKLKLSGSEKRKRMIIFSFLLTESDKKSLSELLMRNKGYK